MAGSSQENALHHLGILVVTLACFLIWHSEHVKGLYVKIKSGEFGIWLRNPDVFLTQLNDKAADTETKVNPHAVPGRTHPIQKNKARRKSK